MAAKFATHRHIELFRHFADGYRMSMIDRYRKPGGFVQLLKLIETCGHPKQEKFLEIVRGEDKLWAAAIERKILTFERVFTWPQETIAEIAGTLQDLTLAIVLHGCSDAIGAKIRATFTHGRNRKVDDLFSTNKPTPAEIQAMCMKVIETVRQMALDGYVRFDKIDPELAIEDGIEERLANAHPLPHERALGEASAAEADDRSNVLDFSLAAGMGAPDRPSALAEEPAVATASVAELSQLRKRVIDLGKENASLRHEITVMRSKLESIRKIV